MLRCPTCAAEIPAASRFCSRCGAAVNQPTVDDAGPTCGSEPQPSSSKSGSEEGRFPSGAMFGERYRILGLLGRGGMGEVYRAFDLKLDQTVALKFLPAATARDPRLLERFRGEVRIARQVSHRNVCRVHDIGEAEGAAFISMEYVDGENLGSLLRQIGRMPPDKAIEIARKLCAGLAAAHEKGVLHRDLKPANIMLDSQGQVRIMDFGLAAAADAIAGGDIRSGTPAYMAPEQKEGREVTVRSDIYSLGLVLHEIVTGKKPGGSGPSLSKDVDPAMEKVIQRCLDPNPRNRFASALDIARALPGGDPLAEALAAGETPSPEMVAASEDTGALSVRATVACFAFVIVALIAAVYLKDQRSVLHWLPESHSPEVLQQKARDLAVRFGYTDPPQDDAFRFGIDNAYTAHAAENWTLEQYRSRLASGWPRLIGFLYRRSPRYLVPIRADGIVTGSDPPATVSGMVFIELDMQGRLNRFGAVPPQLEESAGASFDWTELFIAAGLDRSQFQSAEPQWIPLTSFDSRAAWTGTLDGAPPVVVRIEAAAWKGKPVDFRIVLPWTQPTRQQIVPTTVGERARQWALVAIVASVFFIAGLLAWRHYHSQRGDLSGSVRLAAFAAICTFLEWFFTTHHLPTTAEFGNMVDAIRSSAFWALLLGGLYLALEPYVRRRWPQSLISWTRLLAGGVRDPLVGAHALVGTALGIAVFLVVSTVIELKGGPPAFQDGTSMNTLEGFGTALGFGFGFLTVVIMVALAAFFFLFLLRAALRRDWLAAVTVVAFYLTLVFRGGGIVGTISAGVMGLIAVWGALRFGVLAVVVAGSVTTLLVSFPVTLDFSAWYAGPGFIALGAILALGVWSFRTALGGRKLLKEDLLES
jgi:serine/threonine-protein kinase